MGDLTCLVAVVILGTLVVTVVMPQVMQVMPGADGIISVARFLVAFLNKAVYTPATYPYG